MNRAERDELLRRLSIRLEDIPGRFTTDWWKRQIDVQWDELAKLRETVAALTRKLDSPGLTAAQALDKAAAALDSGQVEKAREWRELASVLRAREGLVL